MAVRTLVVALVLALVGGACGDPLAEKLEADRPDEHGPAKVADADGNLVDAPAPTAEDPAPTGETAPGGTGASVAEPSPTEEAIPTTTSDPGAAAKAAWVEGVTTICREEYAGLSATELPDDPAAFEQHMRSVEAAYRSWADRVEALPIPDRPTEANLREGLRRLRRSIDQLGPAVDAIVRDDVEGARRAWWSWAHSIAGASTALTTAGVPLDCWT